MSNNLVEKSISTFSDQRRKYQLFEKKLTDLLSELLSAKDIKVHLIESRTKTIESFKEKISRSGKHYADPLREITDIVGIRIIVYYLDDVSNIDILIRKEFHVDEINSDNKNSKLSPNEFGYLSLHQIISLKKSRSTLPEWKIFSELKAEIQTRTVLQHAWAAISHQLQYKTDADIPDQLKRKLFRLAGLFELGDEQFIEIRDDHVKIQNLVTHNFDKSPDKLKPDVVTLKEFLVRSDYIHQAVQYAQKYFKVKYEIQGKGYLSEVVEECHRLQITSIQELSTALNTFGDKYKPFLRKLGEPVWFVTPDFILYVLVIAAFVDQFSFDHLTSNGWSHEPAEKVLNIATELHS